MSHGRQGMTAGRPEITAWPVSRKASVPRDSLRPNPKLKLLDQVSEVMRFKHHSLRTEQAYRPAGSGGFPAAGSGARKNVGNDKDLAAHSKPCRLWPLHAT